MSSKVKMIKKEIVIGSTPTYMLSNIRKAFSYSDRDNQLKEWVNSLPDSLNESGQQKVITKIFKHRCFVDPKKSTDIPLPDELLSFVNFMTIDRNIPLDEQKALSFHIIKNAKKISSYETTIDPCKMIVSDRFIYVGGSNEQITYKMMDISKMKELSNLAPGKQIVDKFYENAKRDSVYHMEIQSAISLQICVNNENTYPEPEKKGYKKGVVNRKNPMSRFMIILDIIAPTEKVKNVLLKKVEMVEDMIDINPESKKAKLVKSFKTNIDKEMSSVEKEVDKEVEKELINPFSSLKMESIEESSLKDVEDSKEYDYDKEYENIKAYEEWQEEDDEERREALENI
jgi:hypothetical protein